MSRFSVSWLLIVGLVLIGLTACAAPMPLAPTTPDVVQAPPKVLVVETFLADIAHNVVGDRLKVDSLVSIGVDPHGFEPAPQDVIRISQSQVLIVNGAGFEKSTPRRPSSWRRAPTRNWPGRSPRKPAFRW